MPEEVSHRCRAEVRSTPGFIFVSVRAFRDQQFVELFKVLIPTVVCSTMHAAPLTPTLAVVGSSA